MRVWWLAGMTTAVFLGITMKTTSSTGPKRRKHFPTAQPRSLLFLAMLLLVLAFLQNVPWVVSNDFGQRIAGSRGSHPEFRYMPATNASPQNQMLAQAVAGYGKAGPSAATEDGWNDDTLVADDGARDSKRVSAKIARGILRSTSSDDFWRASFGEVASSSSTPNGGSFFVPLSDLPSSSRGGYIPAAGAISNVTYGEGSLLNSTSSETSLAALSLVSP